MRVSRTRPKVHKAYTGNPDEMPEYRNFMLQNNPVPPHKRRRFGAENE